MKLRLLFVSITVTCLLAFFTAVALAQEEPPAPYAGLQNPFPWDDASARNAGGAQYKQSCLGCHGIQGNNFPTADFSTAGFSQDLETNSDFYFWIVSEGRLDKGMPAYKSSLSEEQRWQVLTYLHSLGAGTPAETVQPIASPATEAGSLSLTAPKQATSGQPITLTAAVKDTDGKPISNAPVAFFINTHFFITGTLKIGEVTTNDRGIATLEYAPRQSGEVELVARYGEGSAGQFESTTSINLIASPEPFYEAEAGIHITAPWKELFIGPSSALDLDEGGSAPMTAFRLPGSVLSWLLILVIIMILIWFTYFRVVRQIFLIATDSAVRDPNVRLIPMVGMAIVTLVGIMLTLMILTGPYSHLHLVR